MIETLVYAWIDFCWAHPLASAIILAVGGGSAMWLVAACLYVLRTPGDRLARIAQPHTSDPCWCGRSHHALNEPELARGQGAEEAIPVFERGAKAVSQFAELKTGCAECLEGQGHRASCSFYDPMTQPREGRKSVQPSEPWPEPGTGRMPGGRIA